MIDFHSHILPSMDDGSDNINTSIKLMECLEQQEIDTLCLSSHYYFFNESINDYIDRRNKAYELLIKNYSGNIKLIKGAEVYYYKGISLNEEIDKLCLEGSDLLLLELPWGNKIDTNELLSLNNQLTIVLAHIERYLDLYSIEEIKHLVDRGIYLQVNSETFNDKEYKYIKELFEEGYIHFIGTDTHNLENRKPTMDVFKKCVIDKWGEEYYYKYIEQMKELFWSRFKWENYY